LRFANQLSKHDFECEVEEGKEAGSTDRAFLLIVREHDLLIKVVGDECFDESERLEWHNGNNGVLDKKEC
jgi:hypothetical protein